MLIEYALTIYLLAAPTGQVTRQVTIYPTLATCKAAKDAATTKVFEAPEPSNLAIGGCRPVARP